MLSHGMATLESYYVATPYHDVISHNALHIIAVQ